jgi:type III secretion protein X
MTDMRLGGLVFDRGIDSITYAQQDAHTSLPERGESAPPDVGARAQLSALLDRPSINDFLESSTRPQIANRDLLVPARFREGLDNALQQLRDAAAQRQPGDGVAGGGDEQLRVLNRATRLLTEEVGLRDLVQMYRSALYQG